MRKEWDILVMPIERHYDNIGLLKDDIYTFQKAHLFDWQKHGFDLPQPGLFEQVQRSDGMIMLIPTALDYTTLFRGQGAFYNPCLPTLYRGDKTYLDIFARRLKQVEFELLIANLPIVRYFRKRNYYVDARGLAQHYGLETDVLDLTSSFDVASFFAMCDYDGATDTYHPKKEEKQYIGYIYAYPALFYAMTGSNAEPTFYANEVSSIGMQPFERPGRQCGFSIELRRGVPFGGYIYSFSYTKRDSERIYHYYDVDGCRLWEPDDISEKATSIKHSRVHTMYALRRCTREYGDGRSVSEYRDLLEKEGYSFVKSNPWGFDRRELAEMDERLNAGGWYDIESKLVHRRVVSEDGTERLYRNPAELWHCTMAAFGQRMPVAPKGYDSGITYIEDEDLGHKVWGWGHHYGRCQTLPNPNTGKIDRWDALLNVPIDEILSAPMRPNLVRRGR